MKGKILALAFLFTGCAPRYMGVNHFHKFVPSVGHGYTVDGVFTPKASLEDKIKAIEICSENIEKDPTNLSAYLIRAGLRASISEREKALADYNKAVELNPEHPEVYHARGSFFAGPGNLGKTLSEKELLIKSLDDFSNVVEYSKRDDTWMRGHWHAARVHSLLGDHEKSLEIRQIVLERFPKSVDALNLVALTHQEAGNYEAAEDIWKKIVKRRSEYRLARAQAMVEMKNYVQAFADTSFIIKKEPKNWLAYKTRANALYGLGEHDEARDDFEKSEMLLKYR